MGHLLPKPPRKRETRRRARVVPSLYQSCARPVPSLCQAAGKLASCNLFPQIPQWRGNRGRLQEDWTIVVVNTICEVSTATHYHCHHLHYLRKVKSMQYPRSPANMRNLDIEIPPLRDQHNISLAWDLQSIKRSEDKTAWPTKICGSFLTNRFGGCQRDRCTWLARKICISIFKRWAHFFNQVLKDLASIFLNWAIASHR